MKVTGGETASFYCYDGEQVIGEYDNSGTLLRKFVYGPGIDEPICLIDVADNNAVYYYHRDGLGSVVAISDANADIVEEYSYDVYGLATITDEDGDEISYSNIGNPYMFTGRRYNSQSGLYYYRARHYDPETGRFLQPDPIGYQGGLNLYAYVGNNPTNWVDPLGLYLSLLLAQAVQNSVDTPYYAGMIFGEIGWWRSQWQKDATTRTFDDYNPLSATSLHQARAAIAHVYLNLGKSTKDSKVMIIPTEEELQDENIRYGWERAVEGAWDAVVLHRYGIDPTNGARHFYLRTGGVNENGIPNAQPYWAKGRKPHRSYGPFRNIKKTGDVPKSTRAYVDIYRGVK